MLTGLQDYTVEDTTEEWILYHNNFSLCSRKVRICLYEYDIEFKSKHIDLIETGKYDVASKDFLKINKNATVPVLIYKGKPIYESHEQIRFLSNKVEQIDSLYLNEEDHERVNFWIEKSSLVGDPVRNHEKYAGNTIGPLTFPLFATMIKYVSIGEILKGLIRHPMKERVILFLALKIFGLKALKAPPLKRIIKSSFLKLNDHLQEFEDELLQNESRWIAGNIFSLADVSWAVIFHRIEECGWDKLLLQNKPYCCAYYEEVKSRKSFKKAILDYNHPILEKGINDLKLALLNNPNFISLYKNLETHIL